VTWSDAVDHIAIGTLGLETVHLKLGIAVDAGELQWHWHRLNIEAHRANLVDDLAAAGELS